MASLQPVDQLRNSIREFSSTLSETLEIEENAMKRCSQHVEAAHNATREKQRNLGLLQNSSDTHTEIAALQNVLTASLANVESLRAQVKLEEAAILDLEDEIRKAREQISIKDRELKQLESNQKIEVLKSLSSIRTIKTESDGRILIHFQDRSEPTVVKFPSKNNTADTVRLCDWAWETAENLRRDTRKRTFS